MPVTNASSIVSALAGSATAELDSPILKKEAVWAIDFTGPHAAVDGPFPHLLAVRDLASGRQLLWWPCGAATAAHAVEALATLFALHGAPLVLKADNGSPFVAQLVRQLAEDFGVELLFSAPGTPQYNGPIEYRCGRSPDRTTCCGRSPDRTTSCGRSPDRTTAVHLLWSVS